MYKERVPEKILRFANNICSRFGVRIVPDDSRGDVYLHTYESYEHYREAQVFHNRRKIGNVWADPATLDRVAALVRNAKPDGPARGLCHGSRNGFEQAYLNGNHAGFSVIGTDISDTAREFPNSVVWDFHDRNEEWVDKFDFVYSNSLDQSWKPRDALVQWFAQLAPSGLLIIEHTADHGPAAASSMDPFGVRPQVMPYLVADWFGHQISIEISVGRKANNDREAWLFSMRKTVPVVV